MPGAQVAITLPNGAEAVITVDDRFVIRKWNRRADDFTEIDIGPATKQNIDCVREYFERLKVHAA
jgi:hypothetical protein